MPATPRSAKVNPMATNTQLINGVDFIAFPTKDWEAARKFYGETLGLPFGKHWAACLPVSSKPGP